MTSLNPSEYLAFLPLLFYGGALVELLSQWKRFVEREYFYLPYILLTVVFTEVAIWNIFIYLEIAMDISGIGYYQYWQFLLQPVIFVTMVHAHTPEKMDKDTKGYFVSRMRVVFAFLAVYLACHFLPGFAALESLLIPRLIGITLCLLVIFTKRVELVYVMIALWFVSLFFRQ